MMSTAEMINRYTDMLGQYDRAVQYDDDGAGQRLAEVSDTLIGHARLLIDRLLEGREKNMSDKYEAARERFEQATANWPKAKAEADQLIREADDEYEAAWRNLCQFESTPGIPLPEYDPLKRSDELENK
jgi:hypothetical protein